jgi:hypothetical protein
MGQVLPHVPQLVLSARVSMQRPPHIIWPGTQAQAPAEHT